jgi:hypothetical protein
MATWTNLSFAFGSILTSTKMTQMDDNFDALAQGASGAPAIQTAAIANQAITTALIADLNVTQAKIASAAVGQGQLNTATGEVSTSSFGSRLTLAGGSYGFYLQVKQSIDDSGATTNVDFVSGRIASTSYITNVQIGNDTGGSLTTFAQQRYIQASPPYEPYRTGDQVPLFVFALIDKTTGEVISTYVAEDPPWANNGPTIINPLGRLRTLAGDVVDNDQALADFVTWARDPANADAIAAELAQPLTQEQKNADMILIPHPFGIYDASQFAVVVLDPTDSVFARALLGRHAYRGESIAEMLHSDAFIIDNSPMKDLATPSGVLAVTARWK